MNRKIFFLATLFSLIIFFANAQESVSGLKPLDIHRFYLGGNGGLNFGTETLIQVEPELGYKITDRWSAGFGVSYLYYNNKYDNYKTSAYGGKIFTRFFITENIFAQAEYGFTNFEALIDNGHAYDLTRINIPFLLVGGGFRQPISGSASLLLEAYYDLDYSIYSPHPYPWVIRGGIVFGL